VNRRDLAGKLTTVIYTILIPSCLSVLISLVITNIPLIIGINLALTLLLGIINVTGVLPRLVFALRRRSVQRHIAKAVKGLQKMAKSYHAAVYNYALPRLRTLVSPGEYIAFLESAEKAEPREGKKIYFQQILLQEQKNEKP
jgi:ABC-type transport system involved in cytochrome bd biosynthesis fused ATPase/permease subunit